MIKQANVLRVLIAEHSSYARVVLEDIIGKSPGIQVCGFAADGDQVLQHLKAQTVDVVIASADLRHNKRLFSFKRIFTEFPTPIMMMVEKEQLTLDLLKEAIELGVYSVILKPGNGRRPNYRSIADEILFKIRAVHDTEYNEPEKRLHMLSEQVNLKPATLRTSSNATADTIIVIGGSTGGTQAVECIVKQLSPGLQASVLVAIHLPSKFTHSFSRRLKALTPLLVVEGRTGLIPKPGKIIVAPGGRNMIVHPVMGNPADLKIAFSEEQICDYNLPSVDQLMLSVAASGARQVIGVILTGMGKDGTIGAGAIIERNGGHVIAQDEETSSIFGMAKSAIECGYIHKVLPLQQIAIYLNRLVAEKQQPVSIAGRDT